MQQGSDPKELPHKVHHDSLCTMCRDELLDKTVAVICEMDSSGQYATQSHTDGASHNLSKTVNSWDRLLA